MDDGGREGSKEGGSWMRKRGEGSEECSDEVRGNGDEYGRRIDMLGRNVLGKWFGEEGTARKVWQGGKTNKEVKGERNALTISGSHIYLSSN